jgi:hypothetical protein
VVGSGDDGEGRLRGIKGFVALRGAFKHDYTNIQALFGRDLTSQTEAALVHAILSRLQSHFDMEENVLFSAIRAAGSQASILSLTITETRF